MANENPECRSCPYNTFKSKGGYGKICNGYTMAKEKRCPEWRMSELRQEEEQKEKEWQEKQRILTGICNR